MISNDGSWALCRLTTGIEKWQLLSLSGHILNKHLSYISPYQKQALWSYNFFHQAATFWTNSYWWYISPYCWDGNLLPKDSSKVYHNSFLSTHTFTHLYGTPQNNVWHLGALQNAFTQRTHSHRWCHFTGNLQKLSLYPAFSSTALISKRFYLTQHYLPGTSIWIQKYSCPYFSW